MHYNVMHKATDVNLPVEFACSWYSTPDFPFSKLMIPAR